MADSLGEVVLGIKVDQAGAQQALQQFGQTAQKETTKVANSIDALRQKLKDQQAQLAGLEIGSGAFAKLRQEIAQTEAALKSAARSPLEAQQAAAREQATLAKQAAQAAIEAQRQAAREQAVQAKQAAREQAALAKQQSAQAQQAAREQATLAKQAARAAVEAEKQATQQRIEQIRRLNEAAKTAAKQRADAEAAAAAQQQAFIGAIRGQIGGLVRGLGVIALGEFFRQGAQEAIELETVTRRLSITLGEQGAARALAFTKGLADELGLSFKTLSGTFSSFTAAATAANVPLDQQQALFTEVAKSATNFGLTSDQLEGALLALQQIASKGTVSMEELRGQLGERLPVAFAAAAKGLGVTQQELIKLVESGKLTSKEFFPAFTAGLKQINGGPSSAPTAAQAIGKLTNAFTELKTELGQGILPLVKPVVAGLAELASLAIRSREARQALGQAQATNLGGFGGLGPTQLKALEALIKGLGGAKLATDSLTAAGKTLKPVLDSLFGKKTKPAELIAKPQTGGADPVKPVIVSIDSLNERIKALRAEQNKVGIGTLRFQELGREIPIVEKALQAATDAAKGASAAVAEIRPDTFNVDTQSAALKLNQARLDLTGQIAQAETDLANAKLRTEEALLNAQEKRALEGVSNDRTRAAIAEEFQLKRDELERRSFELRARALAAENAAQVKALELESKLTELAARRGVIAAQAQLSQAQAKGNQGEVQAAQQALSLAQQEYAIAREISAEKIAGTKQLFELRRQQLDQERRAAAADDLALPQVQQQPGFRSLLDSIQIDPAPIQENSKASLTAAENISNSNTALVDRIGNLEQSIGGLVEKDWTVQVNVTNEAGGAATVNTVNSLQ